MQTDDVLGILVYECPEDIPIENCCDSYQVRLSFSTPERDEEDLALAFFRHRWWLTSNLAIARIRCRERL